MLKVITFNIKHALNYHKIIIDLVVNAIKSHSVPHTNR